MRDLMRTWREGFHLPSLPFIMTELAPYKQPSAEPEDSTRSRFGEVLGNVAKSDGHAWTITIPDGGDPNDIHPPKKEIPGERFAAMALSKVYGKAGIAHGPVLESWKVIGNGRVAVKFSSVGNGLVAKPVNLGGHELGENKIFGFDLADADRHFVRAEASFQGSDTVIVNASAIPNPAAIRYAWGAFPLCNLFNKEGFAAYPFRTDDWPFPTPRDATR